MFHFYLTEMGDCAMDFRDFLIEIAGLKVRMLCDFSYTQNLCKEFIATEGDCDIIAKTNPVEINAESAEYTENSFSKGYCESVCLYRSIAEQMPNRDGFVFHGAAVDIDGKGVIFTAPSGTGKTTHISLLMKNYPESVKIINGDKPILRKTDGEWKVFSTPWAGKEGWKNNTSSPLFAIIILERGADNHIDEISGANCFEKIMGQIYIPHNGEARLRTFDLLDEMSKKVKFYRLTCNMEDEAAKVSYTMLK